MCPRRHPRSMAGSLTPKDMCVSAAESGLENTGLVGKPRPRHAHEDGWTLNIRRQRPPRRRGGAGTLRGAAGSQRGAATLAESGGLWSHGHRSPFGSAPPLPSAHPCTHLAHTSSQTHHSQPPEGGGNPRVCPQANQQYAVCPALGRLAAVQRNAAQTRHDTHGPRTHRALGKPLQSPHATELVPTQAQTGTPWAVSQGLREPGSHVRDVTRVWGSGFWGDENVLH